MYCNTLKKLIAAALFPSLLAVATSTLTAKPLPGKYKGKTGASGTDGRISFKVDRSGRKLSKLNVSAFVLCQDTFGNVGDFVVVATNTDNKKFRMKPSGRFTAKGMDKEGIEYKVTGKMKGSRKFKGSVELSMFRPIFFPVIGSELCSGSRDWKAAK